MANSIPPEPPAVAAIELKIKPDAPTLKRNYSAHLNPVHITTTPSLLSRRMRANFSLSSSEARNQRRELEGRNTSLPLDITGFKHLLMLVLLMGCVKMLWNDWAQFGFSDTLKSFGFGAKDLEMTLVILGTNMLYLPLVLAVERVSAFIGRSAATRGTVKSSLASDKPVVSGPSILARMAQSVLNLLQLTLCFTCLAAGSYLTWEWVDHPLVATGCELNVIVTFLKLASYALTNLELRTAWVKHSPIPAFYESGPAYPENLTLSNLVVFWAAPTLVYQPVYPRRPHIRWSRILPLLFEIVIGNMLIWVLMMQMAQPVLEHLVAHILDWRICLEDYLTLAMINIFIWLTGFVVLFHSVLNLAGEITRFSDRKFYGDWWNAGSVGTFWRDWNLPVSNYFRRHIYTPLRAAGMPRMFASNVVFFISATLHELLFGVGTHNFNGVAFLCMIVQPILILATEPLEKMRGRGTTVGNCVFWLSIMFGQPTATVIYFLQWVSRHPDSKTISSRWWAHMLQ